MNLENTMSLKRVSGLLAFGAGVLLLGSPVGAATVDPTKASELVTLEPAAPGTCPDGGGGYAMNIRVNADGTTSAFSIATGQARGDGDGLEPLHARQPGRAGQPRAVSHLGPGKCSRLRIPVRDCRGERMRRR